VSFSNRTITYRDHAITYVRTEDGREGVGYSLGYEGAGLISEAVESLLGPTVIGEDPRDTERLWHEMYDGTVQIGRAGLLLRAISTVDIALWDLKAKVAGQPLYKLLGGYADAVPSYASGGYYRDKKGHGALRDEMRRYLEEGHDVVKMKIGRRSIAEEKERVAAVREELVQYAERLGERPELVVVSKAELPGAQQVRDRLAETLGKEVLLVSAVTGQGLNRLISASAQLLDAQAE
jgi:D-arabinonate dehydratase